MANTYTLIDKTTLGSSQATVSFSSIPSTYTDLLAVASVRSSANQSGDSFRIYFNGSATNLSSKQLRGNGSGTASYSTTNGQIGYSTGATDTSNTFASAQIYVPNYASSNYKSFSSEVVQETNDTLAYATMDAGLWSSTSAINQITFDLGDGDFVSGSSFYLYGIKNS